MDYAAQPFDIATAQAELAKNPRSADNWNRLAVALLREGNLAGAADAISKAIELQPDEAINYGNRGRLLFALDRAAEAQADYTKAIELGPTADFFSARSVVNLSLGKEAAALSDLNDAFDLEPTVQNLLNRAAFFSNKGMAADALRDMSSVIEMSPDDPNYRLSRANLAFALARHYPDLYELGLSDIERAIELDGTGVLQPSLMQLADLLEASLADSPNPTIVRRLIELVRNKQAGSGVGDQ